MNLSSPSFPKKTTPWVSVTLLVALLTAAMPSQARAGQVFKVRERGAEALFINIDASGIETDVSVSAFSDQIHTPPRPSQPVEPVLFIFIGKFDFSQCNSVLMSAFAVVPLTEENLQVDPHLNSAYLKVSSVELFDQVSQSSFVVDIALNWTASGGPANVTDRSHFKVPGFMLNSRFDGTFRPAVTTGSISDGVTNFASLPLVSADILSVKFGEVDVTHSGLRSLGPIAFESQRGERSKENWKD
jgi:hypothetical protein